MTTILAVKRDGKIAIGCDGQVTLGSTVIKHNATKIRRIGDGKFVAGFAGVSADALALLDRLEGTLKRFQQNLPKACVELAKEWRMDRVLRRLESVLIVAGGDKILMVSGNGDVIEPENDIAAVGSGGPYAQAAATALLKHTKLSAVQIVRESIAIAAGICIYTNASIIVEEI